MNFPTFLTLFRIPLLFAIMGVLFLEKSSTGWQGMATLALILFIIAGVTDFLDGYYARKLNLVSNFGKMIDALTDKILIMGMFIVLLATNILPLWGLPFLLLILSREFLITGLRVVASSRGVVLAADKWGKQKTVFQIIAISFLLASSVVSSDLAVWTALDLNQEAALVKWVGCVTFILATVLTVSSGTNYMLKYWNILFLENGQKDKRFL
jgi:CDP-diacylglycerol---glycerol-3-phosphate 3-phosphatidyltransferase